VKIYPVVMAGGSGTRFWPLSRRARPKQFLPLAGDAPLLVDTVRRLPPLAGPGATYVVCGKAHASAVRTLLPRLPAGNVLVEPVARNTAPCVGLAALHVLRRDPEGILAMLPADHHIGRPAALRVALKAAAAVARGGALVTLGVVPTRPETGYGYLKVGGELAAGPRRRGHPWAHWVERFVEKPDRTRATRYLKSGAYLWNSGIFVFRADVILGEVRRAMPLLSEKLEALGAALGTPRYPRVFARVFPECPSISIDHGVMEKSDRIAVIPCDFGWSDVGSFAALPEVRAPDGSGNVISGDAFVLEGRGNVVVSQGGRPLVVLGLDEVVAVDAGDAVLVCGKERAQEVRKAVDAMQRLGREEVL